MRFSANRQLRLAAILVTLALVGCGSSGPPPGAGGSGYASFAWTLADVQGNLLRCGDVAAGAVVVTLTDQATGTPYTQPAVSCSLYQMSTGMVPAGVYYVGFDLYGDQNTYGNTVTALDGFDVVDTTTGLRAPFHILPGLNDFRDSNYAADLRVRSFDVGWTFQSGSALGVCASLGARYVDLDFLTAASATTVTTRFNCTDGLGVSLPYPYGPDAAQWRLYLLDAAGNEIDHVEGSTPLPPLTADPTDVNLGTAVFPY